MKRRLVLPITAAFLFPLSCLAQTPGRFVQAELDSALNTKTAKAGDPVKAHAVSSAILPNGVKIIRGFEIAGQVRAVDANSIAISFDQVEVDGKKMALSLSVRGAMLPGETPAQDTKATSGAVIGMPGVTLQVDDGPRHASKFSFSGKKLELKRGLQLMLGVNE